MDEHQSGVKLEEALEAKKELDAKAQKILEEKEADSRMRTYTGPLGRAVAVLLCVWTAFQLYFTTIGAISAVKAEKKVSAPLGRGVYPLFCR